MSKEKGSTVDKDGEEREGFTQVEWLELCKYVEQNALKYDDNMKAPRGLYLRLRGLSRGQFMANNKAKRYGEYSYTVILLTFKYSLLSIERALATKKFKSESNKINYIMAIIESNINVVYLRLKKVEESDKKTQNLDMSDNYKPTNYYDGSNKEESNVSDLIGDDIW